MDDFKKNVKLAIVGFLLTGVLGSALTFLFNYVQWQYTTVQQIRQSKTADAREILIQTMQLCNNRFWASQRVEWAAESPQYYDLNEVQKDYSQSVQQWNLNLATTRLLLQDSLGDEPAQILLDDKTMEGSSGGKSVQSCFIDFHKSALTFFRTPNIADKKIDTTLMLSRLKEASQEMDQLYKKMISNYRYVQENGHPPETGK